MSMEDYRPSRFGALPLVVKNILIINVIFFLATFVFSGRFDIDLNDYLGLHYFRADNFKPHQFITYMFMHSMQDFSHILFNMIGVYMFGSVLEEQWGSKRFLIFYLVTGVGAALCQLAVMYFKVEPILSEFATEIGRQVDYGTINALELQRETFLNSFTMVGASGALFGLLLAFGMLFPNTRIYLYFFVPIKAKYFVILYGLLELFSGVSNASGDNVAHFAHLGGMLFGFVMIMMWKKRKNFY